MDRSMDDAAIEEAAEDAPLSLLAGAVLGVLHVVGGILGLVVPLFTSTYVSPVTATLLIVLGVVLFFGSMLLWSPDVW